MMCRQKVTFLFDLEQSIKLFFKDTSPLQSKTQSLATYLLIRLESSLNSSQYNIEASESISHLLTFEED